MGQSRKIGEFTAVICMISLALSSSLAVSILGISAPMTARSIQPYIPHG